MIKLCQVVLSQKLLKTNVLEIKLLEDLNFCFMIKCGVNTGKEIIGGKKRGIGKYVSRYIFSEEIDFLKWRTEVNFVFPAISITGACLTHLRRGWKTWEKCNFFKWDIFSRQSDSKFFFEKIYFLPYQNWIYVVSWYIRQWLVSHHTNLLTQILIDVIQTTGFIFSPSELSEWSWKSFKIRVSKMN